MKKYILKSLFVSVLCMLAASCQDTEIVETLEASQAQIVFPIALDSPSARSRSSWDGYTGLGNGNEYDSHIDFNQFIVQIEANGKTYPVTSIIKLEGGNKFVGIVDEEIKSATLRNAKISIFANMGKESVAETFSQDAENIPMWGVKTVSKLEFAPGKREEVSDPVFMLRAMAKMEVALTPECAAEYDLKAVTLNKHNATGYCLPVGVDAATNTQNMSTAGVFNPKAQGEQTSLQFEPATETSYVVYLPEVAKGTTEEDCLKIEVQLLPKNAPEGTEPEIGTFVVMNYPQNGEPEAINIIRNHWYKYTISGFAASEIQLDYAVVDWQDVGIEIGGDGFLFLNKDVIEIYNSNIDADQLKFSSSSPIKSIVLADLYNHDRDGDVVEGTADGVSAYYISKYGQPVQLGTDPGFPIVDLDLTLSREQVVLSNIQAEFTAGILDGDITIKSPFLADSQNEIPELRYDSHNDTPRYLEFLVTNEQNLTATFRVVQYPPVNIVNIEGFYSYRDDYRVGNSPVYHNANSFATVFGKIKPVDQGAIHYNNPVAPFYALAGFLPYHAHECNAEGVILSTSCTSSYKGFEELLYGFMERVYHRSYSFGGPIEAVFHREHYQDVNGKHLASSDINDPSKYYQALGPCYYDKENGKYFRRHYTGNFFETFWSKYVYKVYTEDGTNKFGRVRYKGQADIAKQVPADGFDAWVEQTLPRVYRNHRMYHIKTIVPSNEYVIGYPSLMDDEGNSTTDSKRGMTAEGEVNSMMVSPSFMVASQLGESILPTNEHHYVVPGLQGIYYYAKRQCQEYVETTYEDLNNNHQWDEGEPVTHYDDWRLPTKKEVDLIIDYQKNSRAMDKVMYGQFYYCASTSSLVYDESTVLSREVEGYITDPNTDPDGISDNNSGYYMRCVRDVKNDIRPIEMKKDK